MTLEGIGLSRSFRRRVVVRDLSLHVAPGEVVGLLGPNGAGKTTTFRMLAGLLKSHGGRVELGGVDVSRWPLWRRARLGLGYLPQRSTIFRRLTVAQNVEVGLHRLQLSSTDLRATRDRLLNRFELTALAGVRGGALSGGETRRVELARALAARPRILMVDEPFAHLDPRGASTFRASLRELAAEGLGVLLTDHHAAQVLEACDRIYILSQGALLMEGTPQAVADDPRVRLAYLGDAP